MKEIIGENMQAIFERLSIHPQLTFQGTIGHWTDFSVWSLTDDEATVLFEMSDEEWSEVALEDAWWRYAEGSTMGIVDDTFVVRNVTLHAWRNKRHLLDLHNDWCDMSAEEKTEYKGFDEFCAEWAPSYYTNLFDYFVEEWGVSTAHNVVALAVDLAKYNNMTLSELFLMYG